MNQISAAQILWEYHLLHHTVSTSDCIVVFCSNDLRVADYAVDLYKKGISNKILFSGGVAHADDLLSTGWDEAEALVFSKRALRLGVTENDIILETEATNSGLNAEYSKKLLQKSGMNINSITLVQKPFMERRAFATIRKVWPEITCHVSSPTISFEEWCRDEEEKQRILHILVGDTQRIWNYAEKGFIVEQKYQMKFMKRMSISYKKDILNM